MLLDEGQKRGHPERRAVASAVPAACGMTRTELSKNNSISRIDSQVFAVADGLEQFRPGSPVVVLLKKV